MKLTLEAPPGLVSQRPDLLVEALATIAKSEGLERCDFLAALAKASGASRAHAHVEGRSSYRILEEAVSRANFIYESAITLAIGEIVDLLSHRLDEADIDVLRGEAGGGE